MNVVQGVLIRNLIEKTSVLSGLLISELENLPKERAGNQFQCILNLTLKSMNLN